MDLMRRASTGLAGRKAKACTRPGADTIAATVYNPGHRCVTPAGPLLQDVACIVPDPGVTMAFATRLLLLSAISLPAAAEPPVPLLWKAEKGAGTVYLLGSFHLLKAADYPLAQSVDLAFDDAERVVFEVPPEQMQSPEMATIAQRYARAADGQTLRGSISKATADKLQAFLGSEAALAAADPYDPWYMGMNLMIMSMVQAGFDPTKGLDLHLMHRASEAGKPTGGLEQAEDQFRALDAIPMAEQESMLADVLLPPAQMRAEVDTLHRQWRSGDGDGLKQTINTEMLAKTPVAYRTINVDRNKRWLPQIESMLEQQDDHLVVVGSLHLLGDDGLVAMLRERGVELERLNDAQPKP
jgi:uncharacterized protein